MKYVPVLRNCGVTYDQLDNTLFSFCTDEEKQLDYSKGQRSNSEDRTVISFHRIIVCFPMSVVVKPVSAIKSSPG